MCSGRKPGSRWQWTRQPNIADEQKENIFVSNFSELLVKTRFSKGVCCKMVKNGEDSKPAFAFHFC